MTAEKQGRSQHDTATSAVVLDDRSLQARGLDDSRSVLANAANVTSVGTGNYAPAVHERSTHTAGCYGLGAAVRLWNRRHVAGRKRLGLAVLRDGRTAARGRRRAPSRGSADGRVSRITSANAV